MHATESSSGRFLPLSRSLCRGRRLNATNLEAQNSIVHSTSQAGLRYSAFISYNHKDKVWAAWLHRALETYTVPKGLRGRESRVGTLGKRLPPVFMDREELASSSDLAGSVIAALQQSASLVVICSPNAVNSPWVNQEIREFRRLRGVDHIHCVVVGGIPGAIRNADLDPTVEAFPPALLEKLDGEPLAVDPRASGDGKQNAKLKLIAGVLGVGFDALRQREVARRHRRLLTIAAGSSLGLLLASGLAIFAFISRAEAIEQRDIARQKTMTAERTVTFVKSLFEVADPAESRGEDITAREMLDRGAARLRTELKTEPAVKADLMTTLAEVYLSLGLYKEADQAIRSSLRLPQPDRRAKARQYGTLAASDMLQGRYEEAVKEFSRAISILGYPSGDEISLFSKLLVGRGEAYSSIDKFAEADEDIQQALRLNIQHHGSRHPDVARDLEALGLNHFFAGKLEKASDAFTRALGLRRSLQGDTHPKVAQNLNALGDIAYLSGNAASAAKYYKKVIELDERILGPNHPDLAATMNNLARVLIEQRLFSEAVPLLRRTVAINETQRSGTHDDLAFIYGNLGLAERGVGNLEKAEHAFLAALVPARMHKHRNLAPVLTDLAHLRCERGQHSEALSMLAEARPIMAADYPDDAWRTAWVDNVRGRCLRRSGMAAEGVKLQKRSLRALRDRWSSESYYGWEAERL